MKRTRTTLENQSNAMPAITLVGGKHTLDSPLLCFCSFLFLKVLQLNCKTQLMERDALNQQHVTQCYAIALIKSRRSLLVVGKTTG